MTTARMVSHSSAVALYSSERFGAGTLDVIYVHGVGLAIFVHFNPAPSEMRSSFGGNVNVTFAVLHYDGISKGWAALQIKVQFGRSSFRQDIVDGCLRGAVDQKRYPVGSSRAECAINVISSTVTLDVTARTMTAAGLNSDICSGDWPAVPILDHAFDARGNGRWKPSKKNCRGEQKSSRTGNRFDRVTGWVAVGLRRLAHFGCNSRLH